MATALPGEALVNTQEISNSTGGGPSSVNVVTVPAGQYCRLNISQYASVDTGGTSQLEIVTAQGSTVLLIGSTFNALSVNDRGLYIINNLQNITLAPGDILRITKGVTVTTTISGYSLFFTEV